MSPEVRDLKDELVIASLQGDFDPFIYPPTYQDKLLFIPLFPRDNDRVKGGMRNWMLIDKNDVDKTGMTCNKIGVSYTAFKNQPNSCGALPMSCLQNQIEDKHQGGSNFLSKFGDFQIWNDTQKILLSKRIDSFQPSVLTLTLKADDFIYMINKSPGQLKKTFVQKFESLSRNGKMYIDMLNTGELESKYSITITECSPNINMIPSQSILASPKIITQLLFDVTTNTGLESKNVCQARLYDSEGGFLDQLEVKFDTSETIHQSDPTPTKGTTQNTNQGIGSGLLGLFSPSCNCSILDFTCLISGCLLWILVSIAILILIIVVCLLFTFSGGWCYLFKLLCCMIKTQRCCFRSLSFPSIPNIELKEVKSKSKVMYVNLTKIIPNFLPLIVGDEFSIKGMIKKENGYIVFYLDKFNYQNVEFQENEYVTVTTPLEIQKNEIIKLRKERFYQEIDVSSKPKYTCIN